jgi:hypothetical protein
MSQIVIYDWRKQEILTGTFPAVYDDGGQVCVWQSMPPEIAFGTTAFDALTGEVVRDVIFYSTHSHYLVRAAIRDGRPFSHEGSIAVVKEVRELRFEHHIPRNPEGIVI